MKDSNLLKQRNYINDISCFCSAKNRIFCSKNFYDKKIFLKNDFIFSRCLDIKKQNIFFLLDVFTKILKIFLKRCDFFVNFNNSLSSSCDIFVKNNIVEKLKKYLMYNVNTNEVNLKNFFDRIKKDFLDNFYFDPSILLKNLCKTFYDVITDVSRNFYIGMMNILGDYKHFKFKKFFLKSDRQKNLVKFFSVKKLWKNFICHRKFLFFDKTRNCMDLLFHSKYLGKISINCKINRDQSSIILDVMTYCNNIKNILKSKISFLRNMLVKRKIKFSAINIKSNTNSLLNGNFELKKKYSLDKNVYNHYLTVLFHRNKALFLSHLLDQTFYEKSCYKISMRI